MSNLILIGPPGSGKGTQAGILVKHHGYVQISTGDMLREFGSHDTELARKIKLELEAGRLISDEIIVELVALKLSSLKGQARKGIIFDGFPRNLFQAQELTKLFEEHQLSLTKVLEISVDQALLIKRIAGRYTCADCNEGYNEYFKRPLKDKVCDVCGSSNFTHRKDDDEETVTKRLKIYKDTTEPVLNYYKQMDKVHVIDGNGDINSVTDQINKMLNNLKSI